MGAVAEETVSLRWYVLRAISGRERRVAQHIEREVARLHLDGLIDGVLVPVEKVFQIRNGRKTSKERVLFPGYVYVEAYLTPEVEQFFHEVPDALGFLTNAAGKAAPLREAEVNRILGKTDALAEGEAALEVSFGVGDTVKVIDGPFSTFTGVVSEVNLEKHRLVVLVKIFERKTPIELSFLQVEKE